MSPTPINNKELNKDPENGGVQVNEEPMNQVAEIDLLAEANAETANNVYAPLPQSDQASEENAHYETGQVDDSDPEDDEEDEEDSDADEVDEEAHFEMLASSRAFSSQTPKPAAAVDGKQQHSLTTTVHSFELDYFERRKTLQSDEIKLDEEKTRTISDLMSGFKLPDSSVPEWAKVVPETVWKRNLLETLNAKKTDLFENFAELPANSSASSE